MAALILHQDLRPIAFALAVLAAYLSANGLLGSRSSPPTFFTVALILAGIALRPTLQLSFIAAASAIFVTIFFALDYIHGDCYYSVLTGNTWPRPGRPTDLEYHLKCTHSAQAWWIMLALSIFWSLLFLYGSHQAHQRQQQRIRLQDESGALHETVS